MKRRTKLLFSVCILLAVTTVFLEFGNFKHITLATDLDKVIQPVTTIPSVPGIDSSRPVTSTPVSAAPIKDEDPAKLARARELIHDILAVEGNSTWPRLDCSAPSGARYEKLRSSTKSLGAPSKPTYFFALDLHQCVNILPRLLGSVVQVINFLGPENCALSIVEGRSDDGTYETLKLLRSEIEGTNGTYFLTTNDTDPSEGPRIEKLAGLRNQALDPLTSHPENFASEPIVVFLNDVAICMEDILELILQRQHLGADMTCAMDWTYVGNDPTFYDVWVARGMTGDTFFEIPPDGNWNSAWNLFWNDPKAQGRLQVHKPFQVYSCWNGANVFDGRALLDAQIRFRASPPNTCFKGEPTLFADDLWHNGYGKIAVVPSVSLEYSDEGAKKLKSLKGYTSQWVNKDEETGADGHIEWEDAPPPLVKCIPGSYDTQIWVPWNESLII